MPSLEDKLRRIAGGLALLVCALALASFAFAAFGVDPLRAWRFESPPMKANTALGLLLAGAALWLQHRGRFPRAGLACAGVAFALAAVCAGETIFNVNLRIDELLVRDAFTTTTATIRPGRMSLHTALALALGAVAVAALAQRRHRAKAPLSAWLANLLVAVAVAALLALAFRTGTDVARPLRLGTHTAVALLLLGIGTLLARPEDKFVHLLFEPDSAGALARRLFVSAALVPVGLCVVLIVLLRQEQIDLADGVILLTVGLILCGFVIALFSTDVAAAIHERREQAEEARLLLTARLQEQAAQLQETVGLRTRELREANVHLRAAGETNALLALVAEQTTNGVVITNAAGQAEWVNAAFTGITGYTLDDIKGQKPGHVLRGPDTDPATSAKLRDAQLNAESCQVEILNYTKTSQPRWLKVDLQPLRDRAGRVTNFIAFTVDITNERAAQQRLDTLHERLALATRAAALGVWVWDATTQSSQWDARTLEIYGLTDDQYHGTGEDWSQRLHPDDRERALAAFRAVLDGANQYEQEFRILRASDGAVRHVESRAIVQRDADGRLLRVTGTDRDITAERDAAQKAEMLNERLRLALRSSNYGVWELDVATQRNVWDDHMFEIYGVRREDFDGSRDIWRQRIHSEDRARAFDLAGRVIAGESPAYDMEFRIVRPDGSIRHIEAHGYLQRDSSGRPLRLVGLNRDITERRQLEERVRKSEELATQVNHLALIGGWEYDVEAAQLTWTDGVRRIHEVEEMFQPTLENTQPFYPPESQALLLSAFNHAGAAAPDFDHELALITGKGRRRWVRVLGRAEFRADGQPLRVHGAIQDVTVRHESEESRRELETQLFQAQKMETLGTLAGGIAHDFNNLLTGIIGYHELAADSVPEDHPARACLAEARNASLRARELVEQILTFGRQSPGGGHGPLDLTLIAEEARRFLRATLPASISLELRIAPDCPPVLGDATQIHQVLLNLGSNAAHAMRLHGGTFTIAIEPAQPTPELTHILGSAASGAYVRLAVSDTGHGMDEATRRRIFDPFFTTKSTQGTGLGLSVVHGIVRAHRGVIDVESAPGAGATFNIYLPAATSDNELDELDQAAAPRGAGEFIFVVDDEEVVGSCTKLVLENKGYQVVVYHSAEQCLAAMHGGPGGCALLVTDQTMPGMQGTELIATIRKLSPGLPVVIMSGYFSKISPQELDELGPIELLAKPFTTDELTNAVHRALYPEASNS